MTRVADLSPEAIDQAAGERHRKQLSYEGATRLLRRADRLAGRASRARVNSNERRKCTRDAMALHHAAEFVASGDHSLDPSVLRSGWRTLFAAADGQIRKANAARASG